MLRVKVIKAFNGVEDGHVYPRHIPVGDIISGDLAAVALKEKWATDKFDEPPQRKAAPAPVQPAAPAAPAPETADAAQIEIPADWKTKPYFSLQKLADEIKGDKVKDKAECLTVIQAEIDRRAAAAPMTTAALKA